MKVLLTGANGFLGIHLLDELLSTEFTIVATGTKEKPSFKRDGFFYEQMDFTDPYSVHDVFEKHKPAIVIHAGAMTVVDACETDQWEAYTKNVEGTLNLLANAEELGCFFVFVSTDFVFNGGKGNYKEEDETSPVNFYGKTKEEAEQAVAEYKYQQAIVRTSLVYGKNVSGKHNIATLVKEKLEKGEGYGLVNDQYRSPTYVKDLAKGIVSIIEKKAEGIFHLAVKEILTPYEIGQAIQKQLRSESNLIKELSSQNFTQPAKRPARTNLDISKAISVLGYNPLGFEEALAHFLFEPQSHEDTKEHEGL